MCVLYAYYDSTYFQEKKSVILKLEMIKIIKNIKINYKLYKTIFKNENF